MEDKLKDLTSVKCSTCEEQVYYGGGETGPTTFFRLNLKEYFIEEDGSEGDIVDFKEKEESGIICQNCTIYLRHCLAGIKDYVASKSEFLRLLADDDNEYRVLDLAHSTGLSNEQAIGIVDDLICAGKLKIGVVQGDHGEI